VGVVAICITVGTGGIATPDALPTQNFTGSIATVCPVGHLQRDTQDFLLGVQEKIAGIRQYLSLTMTDLAAVLQVGRPTAYAWVGGAVAAVQNKHRARLDHVYKLAREWREISSRPLDRVVSEPLGGGVKLIDLLTADDLDDAAIRNAFAEVKILQDRAARRLTVREVAAKTGVKLATRSRRNWPSSGDIDI
jgi:transcriptional regulator with XRE-family HTH domain